MAGATANETLIKAVSDAEQMLSYSAHRGVALDQKDIDNVVVARRAIEEQALTKDQETAFWTSSAVISKAIFPVSLETLAASTPIVDGKRTTSLAAKAASRYRIRTIVTLAFLLVFQIYWLIGATVVTDLKDARARLEKIQIEFDPGRRKLDALIKENKPEAAQEREKLSALINVLDSNIWVERISAHTNFQVLSKWNIGKAFLLWGGTITSPANTKTPTPKPLASSDSEVPPGAPAPAPETSVPQTDDLTIKPNDSFLWIFNIGNVVELQTAQIVLTALLKYILPILYGALGASAFIVRTVANEIRELTYSPESNVRYQLRFYLGAVAGFSIAWFTSDAKSADTAGILQSLSPLALAFLAGYSVDLLFSLLDRLVLAFSAPDPKRGSA